MMRFKHFQAIAFGCAKAWSDASKAMTKVSVTVLAVVLGRLQVQRHELIALSGVLDSPLVGSLYSELIVATMQAGGSFNGLGPDLNTSVAINTFDFKVGETYNTRCEGHR